MELTEKEYNASRTPRDKYFSELEPGDIVGIWGGYAFCFWQIIGPGKKPKTFQMSFHC